MSVPERIGRHRILECIGTGGFATVWRGYDADLDSDVAIKILAENWAGRADIRDRFVDEARMLRRADSDRIVRVHDIGTLDDDRPYFVMTHADRGTLQDRLSNGLPAVPDALRVIEEAARCVAILHDIGVLHRDIKPSNILFRTTASGDGERIMLADLGVAKALTNSSGFTVAAGSPGYMAPEQANIGGALDVRADVFALGALAYLTLTGTQPVPDEGRPPSQLRQGIPADVDAVVLQALAADRERRHPHATAFATAIAATSQRHAAQPPPVGNHTVADTAQPPVQASVQPPGRPPGQAESSRPAATPAPPYPAPAPPGRFADVVAPEYPGTPVPQAATRPRRPPGTLTAGTTLTILGSVSLFLLSGALLLVYVGLHLENPEQYLVDTDMTLEEGRVIFSVGSAVCAALAIALIILANRARKGRQGARIALTVLGVVNVAIAITSTVSYGLQATVGVGAIYIALAVILYWVGGSNAWFRRAR